MCGRNVIGGAGEGPETHGVRMPARVQNPPRGAATRADFILRTGHAGELATLVDIDDDACALFVQAGFDVDLSPDHPYTRAEHARWQRCLGRGSVVVADAGDKSIGFAALDQLDGSAYLEQLSVRGAYMRRGLGAVLIASAITGAVKGGAESLWLTTYDHLSWNRPYYERHGFERVAESKCGPDILRELENQRHWLPFPERRIVMRRPL
jgi:N-acetylglutamate synthase-like GNAT family acetyltransferase